MLTPEDKRLVEEFNRRTRLLSPARAAAESGVGEATIRRWRKSLPSRITTESRMAAARYLDRTAGLEREPEVHDIGQVTDHGIEGVGNLLYSSQALYATLTEFGGPGEHTDDKLSLIDLLSQVAARLRREGKRIPVEHLSDAHARILRGEV